MAGRPKLKSSALMLSLLATALSLSAASNDNDNLHPDPRNIGVGVKRSGHTPKELDDNVRQHPRSAQAYLERGDGHLSDSEIDEAMADFNKAIELDPHCTRAYFGRYFVLCDGHHQKEAMAALKKVEELGPPDLAMDAVNLEAMVHQQEKKWALAKEEFTRVIKTNLFSRRRTAGVFHQRGISNDRLGRIDDAIADYTTAIKLDPEKGVSYLYRANDNRGRGELKKAWADYDYVARHVENVPSGKLPQGMEAARKDLYRFRSLYYKAINRPDLAKADMTRLYREEREDLDVSPFQER